MEAQLAAQREREAALEKEAALKERRLQVPLRQLDILGLQSMCPRSSQAALEEGAVRRKRRLQEQLRRYGSAS